MPDPTVDPNAVIDPTPDPTPDPAPAPKPTQDKSGPDPEALKKTVQALEARLSSKDTALKLTQEEKSSLEESIRSLNEQLYSKEELRKAEVKRAREEAAQQAKSLEADRDAWRQRYTQTLIHNQITAAALHEDTKAKNPGVFVELLANKAQLKEKVDESGKLTGEFEVLVKIDNLVVDPYEALKSLKQKPEWGFMFADGASGNSVTLREGDADLSNVSFSDFKKIKQGVK